MPRITLERARAAKAHIARQLANLPTLTGIGLSRVKGEYAVKVNLSEPLASEATLPDEVDGVPLRIEITGPIRPR